MQSRLFFVISFCLSVIMSKAVIAHPGHGVDAQNAGVSHYLFSLEHAGAVLFVVLALCLRQCVHKMLQTKMSGE